MQGEVTEEEYEKFYKAIAKDWQARALSPAPP